MKFVLKKLLILVVPVLLFIGPAISQTHGNSYLCSPDSLKLNNNSGTGFKKNILKIDPGKLILGGINLSYERVITQWTSINVRAQYHSLGFIERWIGDFSTSGDNYTFGLSKKPDFYAIGFDAEYRLYLKNKKSVRRFYIAPYLRYQNYTGKFESLYTGTFLNKPVSIDGDLTTSFDIWGGGAQFGIQWIIKDKVSIDWGFAGLGADNYTFQVGVKSDNLNNAVDQYTSDLQNVMWGVNSFLAKKLAFYALENKLSSDVSFWMIGWKSFLTIGIAF
jgi:hypothetical protein